MTLERILLAVGPGDRHRIDEIADTAASIAGPAGADVVIAHVFDKDDYADLLEEIGYVPEDADPTGIARRHTGVTDLSERLEEAGVSYSIRGEVGPIGDTIVDIAAEIDADLVIVGGRRRSPTGKAVFGSTAQEVMLSSPAPVAFVRGD